MSSRTRKRGAWAGISTFLILSAIFLLSADSEQKKESTNLQSGEEHVQVNRSDEEWKQILTPEEYRVLREKGTEPAFCGAYFNTKEEGTYVCAGCGLPLFRSSEKYESGTGWPSYWKPIEKSRILEKEDRSLGMKRTEVVCARCGGHLGHVFHDGPPPTGLRYCINSAALDFKPQTKENPQKPQTLQTATFGAGCFWCTEAAFETVHGVKSITVGYMGGDVQNPTYHQVSGGRSGHAEVAQITYDPNEVSYEKLLDLFWKIHDPTSLNRQGADVGPQYRSVIFYQSEEQKRAAEKSRDAYQKKLSKPIVTKIVPAAQYYIAEEYHQDYYKKNPDAGYCRLVIAPKLKKLEKSRK